MHKASETAVKREREVIDPELVSSLHEKPSDARKVKSEEDKSSTGKRWTPEQDEALKKAVEEFGQRNWKSIASRVHGRNHAQCLQRWNKVLKPGLVKGHWSYEEDSILESMVLQGCHSWGEVAAHIPGRTAKQCRERWRNHLDPSINKAPFTPEEDMTIQKAYESLGNRWTQIAELLPGRTEDAVKLRWKTLNPNQKTNAKPGRPRLMPGMNINKARSTAPPNPAEVAVMVAAPVLLTTMPQFHQEPGMPLQPGLELHGALPEPTSLEHNVGIDKDQFDSAKDAVILQQLLRSQSNSLLSFGSTRGLNSFADMSPDELLASGELDEMLRAVSLANVSSSKMMDSKSSAKLADSFTKAMDSLDRQKDKHLFQELIDELRPGAGQSGTSAASNFSLPEPTPYASYSYTTKGNVNLSQFDNTNLLHSLDYEEPKPKSKSPPPTEGSISSVVGTATSGIDDLLDPDMMRPFRNGVQF